MSSGRVWKPHPEWVFSLALVGLFSWMIYEGSSWPLNSRLFPMVVAYPMLALSLFQMAKDLTRRLPASTDAPVKTATSSPPLAGTTSAAEMAVAELAQETVEEEAGLSRAGGRQIAAVGAQMLAYFAGMYLIGFIEVIPIYTALYLRFAAKEPWWRALGLAAFTWAFTWGLFSQFLHLPFPSGVLVGWLSSLP
ncbi:MAG: tripartite tricarboxylate transporter TctB family protein [Chloroflexi bacterium]|nr:tripartite tricarboxylate transporter TctB family protein [Chloroflexota bacterium]